ncbi:MAG: ABC transporter substrate-binding protein, partial [Candidatus Kariarchaeaceae archaeon]
NYAFIAPDYSFGWAGVNAMQSEVIARGGKIVATEYVTAGGFGAADITPYLNRIKDVDTGVGVDMLMIVWAGSFSELYRDMEVVGIPTLMNVSGGVIDTWSMTFAEGTFTPPATLVGTQGLAVYGYELANNPVNDWMVQEYVNRDISTSAHVGSA